VKQTSKSKVVLVHTTKI